MLDILFDAPWWLPAIPIGVGAIVAFTGMRRLEKSVIRGGLSVLLVGLLIGLISYFGQTDREKAFNHTRQLISAADRRDWPAFQALIDSQTSVYTLQGPASITNAAREITERFDVKTLRITGSEVTQHGPVILVNIRIYSEQRGMSGLTDWRLEYQKSGSEWLLQRVSAVSNEQINEDRIRSMIPRR